MNVSTERKFETVKQERKKFHGRRVCVCTNDEEESHRDFSYRITMCLFIVVGRRTKFRAIIFEFFQTDFKEIVGEGKDIYVYMHDKKISWFVMG